MPSLLVLLSTTSLLLSPSFSFTAHAFSISSPFQQQQQQFYPKTWKQQQRSSSSSSTCLYDAAAIGPLLAGSVGGAIGVGVAYPLDSLKTKAQVYNSNNRMQSSSSSQPNNNQSLLALVKFVYQMEGIGGFFGGVKAMMIGQALIKSVAFGANEWALTSLNTYFNAATTTAASAAAASPTFLSLLLAAAFAGFVTSFLVAPVERVKVMMQAQQGGQQSNDANNSEQEEQEQSQPQYANEIECIQAVLQNEGWIGLFSRGLGPTLAREVPSYAIYFCVYGLLLKPVTTLLGVGVAPLVCGAISGCACWIPVYPVDVVKTLVQNTEGGSEATGDDDSGSANTNNKSAIDVAIALYREEGPGAFWNGLTPKMLRASVNHAVTFWVYDWMMRVLA